MKLILLALKAASELNRPTEPRESLRRLSGVLLEAAEALKGGSGEPEMVLLYSEAVHKGLGSDIKNLAELGSRLREIAGWIDRPSVDDDRLKEFCMTLSECGAVRLRDSD